MAVRLWSIFTVSVYIINILAVDPTEYPRESSTDSVNETIRLVNETVTFKCPKEDNVKWKVKNTDSKEFRLVSDSQIFKIRNLSVADEGVYACYSNDNPVSTYKLNVYEPPSFVKKKQMIQQLVVKPAGNMVQLKCRAGGNPTPNITWLKDGKPPNRHLGELKYNHWSLTLEDLVTDDKGNYTCLICNVAGCINYTYRVDVVERYHNKPILTKSPENITDTVGSNVSFECKFLWDLHPFIIWVKLDNGNEISENVTVLQAGKTLQPEILELNNVTYEDQGWYACVAANSLGQTVSKAYLTVVDVLPKYSRESSTDSVNETIGLVNETVTFKCPKEDNVKWKVKNTDSKEFRLVSDSHIFEIRNLSVADEGVYACYSNDDLVSTYKLNVYEPPSFVKKNQMIQQLVVKPAGNMVQLKCRAGGNPTPNITWLKDGKPPNRHLGELKYNHWSLTLEDLVTDDKGNYTCLICNVAGCINYTFQVDVVERFPYKPYIKDGFPENVTALVNSTVRFECPQLVADLEPYIQWIYINSSYEFNEEEEPSGTPKADSDNTLQPEILELHNVTYEDQGWYACVAANTLGQTVSKAYLTVVDVLPIDIKETKQVTMKVTLIIVAVISCVILLLFFICIYYRQNIKRVKVP